MTREEILEQAKTIVCGDRDAQYGAPENSFAVIAELWQTYIEAQCLLGGEEVIVSPEDVAAMMALVKVARIATGKAKADNWIDLAGYAACGGELQIGGRGDEAR